MNTKVSLYNNNNLYHHKSQNESIFSEISPIWSERLNQARDNISPFSLTRLRWYYELKNPSKCVVGEAYRFSSIYTSECKKCSRLGWRFMFYFLIQSNSRIEQTKLDFADHWNKEHSEIKTKNKMRTNEHSNTNSQVKGYHLTVNC
jgi:hypothetical protein